ncbi:MAG: hypothetical protein UHK60_04170 [Acutalibacteraceae bacterium]|nr:hypothetical protein [Acutalibacteraceae bacterium]
MTKYSYEFKKKAVMEYINGKMVIEEYTKTTTYIFILKLFVL